MKNGVASSVGTFTGQLSTTMHFFSSVSSPNVLLSTHNESGGRRQDQSLHGFAHVNPLICTESGEKEQWRPFCLEAKVLPDLCTCTQEPLQSALESFSFFFPFSDLLTFKPVWRRFFHLIDLSVGLAKEKRSAAFWVGHRCRKSYRWVSKTSRLVLKSDGGN